MNTAITIAMITTRMITSAGITAPMILGDSLLILDVLLIPELDGFSVSGLTGEVLSSELLVEVTDSLGTSEAGGTGISLVD